ncbi:M50 family metallopeptidase [Pseudonocardia spinosispora]|uniref:M50 family metallopeptidase n=1 Tax=Pseudonocardia spinosispora TaxID=103441 RepID=UPI000428369E|nr:M50 family metallopeptidase [Pseudonocardia spinosispora]
MPEYLVPLLAPLVALVVVGQRGLWRVSRTVVTIAHEGGHALVAVLTGRRLTGIRLHSDTSGVTVSVGRPTGPGMVATALAGYLAPSLAGLLAAGVITLGGAEPLLWAAIVVLLATLLYIRNFYGGFAVLVTGAAVGLVAWYGSPGLQVAFASAAAWFLLFGGLRAVRELGRARGRQVRRGAYRPDSDADQLARLTRLPPWFWVALFTLVAVGALVVGAYWMLADPLTALAEGSRAGRTR